MSRIIFAIEQFFSQKGEAMETIGQRLKKVRTAMNLTTTDIKNKTGISTGNYSEWERDIKIPNGKGLISLKEVLKVSIDWILTGEELEYNETLTESEKKLLEKFKQLNEYYKTIADYKINELIKEQEKETKDTNEHLA